MMSLTLEISSLMLLPIIIVIGMSYQDEFQAIVRAAAREVSIRSQTAYWLLAEKNKDLVSILSGMREVAREKWIRGQVLKSYEEAKWYLGFLEPRIQYAEDRLQEAVMKSNVQKTDQYKDQLLELGESYLYWMLLFNACRDIYDAVWKLGTVVPVPDFDEEPDDDGAGPGDFLSILRGRGQALHRSSRAALTRMEDQREEHGPQTEEIAGTSIRRADDRRVRPLDEVMEADRRRRELDAAESSELRVRGIGSSRRTDDDFLESMLIQADYK